MGLLYRSRSGANYVRYPFLSGRFTARCFPSTKPQKTTGAPQQIPQGLLHLQATPGQGLSNCHAETSSSDVDRTQCDEVRPVCGACSFRDEPCSFPPPDEQTYKSSAFSSLNERQYRAVTTAVRPTHTAGV
ncbi:hypothetical protein An07g00840 [Aspergillus niger]|uniref:Uncharacterized protein n=2 Tax=Aspergillus niger TaxID=5061 RepID=A2QM53_ASPNC|nr:hypothetical protein An07g00840 [Aspergillus niger]CAK96534.1 hypothetical protein An07g00840 [Aspergillus niger]